MDMSIRKERLVFLKSNFARKLGEYFGNFILLLSVTLASTIFPRFIALGGQPMTDDGHYISIAQFIHHNIADGVRVPEYGGLALYPMLTA
jgi:hypothetical protein